MKKYDSDGCRNRFKRSSDGDEGFLIVDSSSDSQEDSSPSPNSCWSKVWGFFQMKDLATNIEGYPYSCLTKRKHSGVCAMFPSCMSLLSKRQDSKPPRPGQTAVVLNVYDMYWTNWYTAGAGLGVYHSGVQVHDSEWAYGGHPYSFTGVFDITPRDAHELGEQFRFRQSVHVGYTDFTDAEVRRLVAELGKQFRGDKYHLMNNNCNHFTSAFCQALCNNDIPAWVNRLAYVSSCVPFLQRCLPKEWLTPAALQHSLAAHSRSSSPQTPQTPQ